MPLTVILCAIIGLLVICVVLLAVRLRAAGKAGGAGAPAAPGDARECRYRRRTYLLSRQEQHFYRALASTALELNLHLFVKVRLADIIEPLEGFEENPACVDSAANKKVDFLLCRDTALSPVLVVELDDPARTRRNRDALKEKTLVDAGLAVLRVKSAAGLREKVAAMLPPAADMDYPAKLGPGELL